MNTTNKALTVKDVASYLNVDEKTIYRLVSKGSIPGFKVSGSWRFQLQDIQGWIDLQKNRARQMPGKKSTNRS